MEYDPICVFLCSIFFPTRNGSTCLSKEADSQSRGADLLDFFLFIPSSMWVSIMQLKLVSDSHCPEFDRTGSAKRWMGGFILPKLNLLNFMQELKVET